MTDFCCSKAEEGVWPMLLELVFVAEGLCLTKGVILVRFRFKAWLLGDPMQLPRDLVGIRTSRARPQEVAFVRPANAFRLRKASIRNGLISINNGTIRL